MSNPRVLVDRRIGGLGDLMMLSRPLSKIVDAGNDVSLVLDQKWHPLFSNWDIELLDSPSGSYDLTYRLYEPCPAGTIEAEFATHSLNRDTHRTFVGIDRISSFAISLGVKLDHSEKVPLVKLSEGDIQNAIQVIDSIRGPMIYVQLNSAESYRDWDRMEDLVKNLSSIHQSHTFVCYSDRPIEGAFCFSSELMTSIALMQMCDLVISPDSMSVHASAALEVPCVSIYGPVGAETRIENYPYCSAIMRDLPCLPCWRYQHSLCEYKGTESSFCLESLPVDSTVDFIDRRMKEIALGDMVPSEKYCYA